VTKVYLIFPPPSVVAVIEAFDVEEGVGVGVGAGAGDVTGVGVGVVPPPPLFTPQ